MEGVLIVDSDLVGGSIIDTRSERASFLARKKIGAPTREVEGVDEPLLQIFHQIFQGLALWFR